MQKDWDWGYWGISYSPNFKLEWIDKYPDKPWNWYGISRNPNITMDIIEKYPDKPWDWGWCGLSDNPILGQRLR